MLRAPLNTSRAGSNFSSPSILSRWRPGLLALASVAMLLSACGGSAQEGEATSTGLALRNGTLDAKLQGSWRVLGEGRLIEVDGKEIRQFQETNSICYADRQVLPAAMLEGYIYRRVQTSAHATLDLYATSGAPSAYTLQALDKIPDACRQKPPVDAVTIFKTMWDIFDLDYGFFTQRNIDWPAKYSALVNKLTTTTDEDTLQAVLIEALEGFNDAHVSMVRFDNETPVFQFESANSPTLRLILQAFAQQSDVQSLDTFAAALRHDMQMEMASRLSQGSSGRVLNGAMVWGRLPGNIGYIELSRMADFSDEANTASDLKLIRAEMDRAISALSDTQAMIVDVAINDGGYDVVSAEVAGRFANGRYPAFTVHQRRPQGRQPQSWFVEPKGLQQYLKPVFLLTTDLTVSAGDTLALMMRPLPNVTQVGQTTSGSLSNKLVKSLPGNFVVTLSNESYVDPQGVLYEGRGVPPKMALQVFDPLDMTTLRTGHLAAINQVIKLIGRSDSAP